MYIWEHQDWPGLSWDEQHLAPMLTKAHRQQGRLLGKLEALGFELQGKAYLETLTREVVKSSEIEGEQLDSDQVRSSIARRLGMDIAGLVPADRNVEGVVEMMLDATREYASPLTTERLFDWHAALFPTGRTGIRPIRVAKWRDDNDGPMQVVSGPIGRERVHFEGPPADRVADEMKRFQNWFNAPGDHDPLLTAAQAHLWFVTIHPFDDGNGRIARAITDMALARGENSAQRFYSMSAQVQQERDAYYQILEHSQKETLDITEWLAWFLGCLTRAVDAAHVTLDDAICKARFWDRFNQEPLNERQIKVLQRVMDNFEGKLTSSKWARIAKCSQDTAGRDIADLIKRGALKKDSGGGRSTSYSVILEGKMVSDTL